MDAKPLHDKILIEKIEEDEHTQSGIFIPNEATEQTAQGKVIETGEGRLLSNDELRPLDIKQGDLVLFEKAAGVEVFADGTEYLVMKEDDILAIVENDS